MIGIGKTREPKTGAFKAFVAFSQHPKTVIHPWEKGQTYAQVYTDRKCGLLLLGNSFKFTGSIKDRLLTDQIANLQTDKHRLLPELPLSPVNWSNHKYIEP